LRTIVAGVKGGDLKEVGGPNRGKGKGGTSLCCSAGSGLGNPASKKKLLQRLRGVVGRRKKKQILDVTKAKDRDESLQ